ncbi:MAG: DUF2764 domain-containing protein [Leptospiraceae bacterium]|nr:DUF2764 domain-containing protein [Leptospiraceae bacterium]MDW8306944.1 DUF2764 family protein [Leptospiraceae bacterium]
MARYIYLISGLPEISTESARLLPKLLEEWEEELKKEDLEDLRFLIFRNDNKNLLKFLRAKDGISLLDRVSMHEPCVFSFVEIENIYIEEYDGEKKVPEYWLFFLEEEKKKKLSLQERERLLVELYYEAGISHRNPLVRKIFLFKRDMKNLLLAINAYRHNLRLENIVVGNYDLPEILLRSQESYKGLAKDFPFLSLWEKLLDEKRLVELEQEIDLVLVEYIDSVRNPDNFSFDYLIRYYIDLAQRYRWLELSPRVGKIALEELTEHILQKAL